MAEGTSAGHAMPKTIRRVEQGVYRSLDDAIEIRQTDKGWTATVLAEVEGRELKVGQVLTEKPAKTRGDVVKLLDEQQLLPAEAPKQADQPEAKQEQESKEQPDPKVTESHQGIGGRNGHSDAKATVLDPGDASGAEGANGGTGERKRRPRAQKAEKAGAKV